MRMTKLENTAYSRAMNEVFRRHTYYEDEKPIGVYPEACCVKVLEALYEINPDTGKHDIGFRCRIVGHVEDDFPDDYNWDGQEDN